MKKREFWELIERNGGSCKGVPCLECRFYTVSGSCKAFDKYPGGTAEKRNEYRLADARSWLARHPKIDSACLNPQKVACFTARFGAPEKTSGEVTRDKPFVPATEFIPGKFYQSKDGEIVFCTLANIVVGGFGGVSLTTGHYISGLPINGAIQSWGGGKFSGPVEVEIKVVDK